LNEVRTNIFDYMTPTDLDDEKFRSMWSEFEWENKLRMSKSGIGTKEYVETAARAMRMQILTPSSALEGECGVLAANMHAESVFGEHALANISLEHKRAEGGERELTGVLRIRAKSQGMALALGKTMTQSNGTEEVSRAQAQGEVQ
jgi:coatomer subunit beta